MSEFESPGETVESPYRSAFVHDVARAARPLRATRIDWQQVARLQAAGNSTAQVAQFVGCSRRHIWRILRRSRRLDEALAREMDHEATNASLILAALRPVIAEALETELRKGNVNVLLRLADRLNVFERPSGPAGPAGANHVMTHEERLRELE